MFPCKPMCNFKHHFRKYTFNVSVSVVTEWRLSWQQNTVFSHWIKKIHATFHIIILFWRSHLFFTYNIVRMYLSLLFPFNMNFYTEYEYETFWQANMSLKRYSPWKIWPFIVMFTQINDPNPLQSHRNSLYIT